MCVKAFSAMEGEEEEEEERYNELDRGLDARGGGTDDVDNEYPALLPKKDDLFKVSVAEWGGVP